MGNGKSRKREGSKKKTKEIDEDVGAFGKFLIDVKNNLTNENIMTLVTAFNFKPAERDKVERCKDPGLEFVHILKEKGIISLTDISALTKELRTCDLQGIADEISNSFSKWVPNTNPQASGSSLNKQESKVEESRTRPFYLLQDMSVFQHDKGINTTQSREAAFNELSERLGIKSRKEKLTMIDCMFVNEDHFTGEESDNIINNFIGKLTSYDYRAQNIRLSLEEETDTPEETLASSSLYDVVSHKSRNEDKCSSFSTRDIIYVILNYFDPFLRQDILTKLAACQLAVPILLLDAAGLKVTMLLWGLRKISKSWCEDPHTSSIREGLVAKCPFLSIAAFRIGSFPLSKSNILNKFLGPTQGNDDHAFFTSFEQDSCSSVLSQGTLECVWYLPGSEKGPIKIPFALLNLRGDSIKYNSQASFALQLSFVAILFMEAASTDKNQHYIEEIASHSYVIVVIYEKESTGGKSKTLTKFMYPLTIVFSGGMSALEIGREISKGVQAALQGNTSRNKKSLEDATDVAKELYFEIDEEDVQCSKAKHLALQVKEEIQNCNPHDYKLRYFHLQQLWKKWSLNERNRSWTSCGNIEHAKALHEDEQTRIREEQSQTNCDSHIKNIRRFLLNGNDTDIYYFVSWLQAYLNDIATEYIKPLTSKLTKTSFARRELSKKIHQLETDIRNAKTSSEDKQAVDKLRQEERNIYLEEEKLIKQFDENTLGIEHFIREFGQMVESKHYTNKQSKQSKTYTKGLPTVVAKMLLEGHPLEILDGDACHVPLMWIKAVFHALASLVGKESKLYVISVLGIQSSGKSTLLNSMFGVRFATSAGRCTRGVFLQLLPVDKSLAPTLHCDYIAIVDTEGLRAPEKTLSPYTEQDNELATFALCISDLTLINIGGQTMGEDMMNVLQIGAHAFVRMKEVDLNPECRIVQQFVADVTAEQKNESAMQSIIMKLDEAACEAAKREGKEHVYRQFSDIFTLQNYESDLRNIQYIPSLWRGFMAAPDYQYSVRVQQLKSTILQSIHRNDRIGLTLLEFQQRITDVWNAILKEDFVFSFQNTKEVSLYQEVMLFYRTEIQPIREALLEMEFSAKSAVACAKFNVIDSTVKHWMVAIKIKLADLCGKVSTNIESKFNEKRYLVVKKYNGYFQADLKNVQTQIEHSIRVMLMRNADLTKSEHKKFSVVEDMKKKIRDTFVQVANELRSDMEKKLKEGIAMKSTDTLIDDVFKRKWKCLLEEVDKKHPLKSLKETFEDIKSTIVQQIIQDVSHSDVSKECIELLKLPINTYSSTPENLNEKDINNLKILFTSISIDKNESFSDLVTKIKQLAEDHKNFTTNVSIAMQILKKQLWETFSDSNLNFVLLYLCFLFVTKSYESEQTENLNLLLCDNNALEEVCANESIVPKARIKCTFLDITLQHFYGTSDSLDLKTTDFRSELENERENINIERIDKDPMLSRLFHFLKQQQSTAEWFRDFVEYLKTLLVGLEEKYNGKICTEALMTVYVKSAKARIDMRNLGTKRHRADAIKIVYKVGICRFTEAFKQHLRCHVMSSKFLKTKSNPLKQRVLVMRQELTKVFPQQSTIMPELNENNVWDLSALPPTFSFLRTLDSCFINMVPQMTAEKMQSVIGIMNAAKCSILLRAKPKTDFNANLFARDIGELIQKTDEFSKEVQASAIVHVASWALPIYARCRYNYEREKNITVHIAKDEKVFKTEFMSLSSNCQDEAIAERCFEIIENAIYDGLIDELYKLLYASSLKMDNEFQSKKIFIGFVLKDLFLTKNYDGISELLNDFQAFSLKWILNFYAKKYSQDNSFLQSNLKACFDSLVAATRRSIEKTASTFKGKGLLEWIISFTLTFKENTKLSCDQNKVDVLLKYLRVTDFKLLSESCLSLLDIFHQNADISLYLPCSNTTTSIKTWMMNVLPKQLNVDIFYSFKGCNAQCPFCGTVCHHSLTEHPKHESMSHFPSGLHGWHNKYSKKLCIDICNSAVESNMRYLIPGPVEEYRPYKDYEVDFPTWKIRGQIEGEPSKFWKRIFVIFNRSLAEKYNCKEGDIPSTWHTIDDNEAMQCLCEAYNV